MEMSDPDKTDPYGQDPTREYPFPSCPACLRMAERRGLRLGALYPEGRIEAFFHAGGEVVALCNPDNGFIVSVPMRLL